MMALEAVAVVAITSAALLTTTISTLVTVLGCHYLGMRETGDNAKTVRNRYCMKRRQYCIITTGNVHLTLVCTTQ
jgi:hypothetical protein